MPSSKSDAVAIMRRNQDIVQQALEGRSVHEIADDYSLSEVRVRQILDQAMEESRVHIREDAHKLLARNYARVEVLIVNLMEMALEGDAGGQVSLPAVDRLIKLVEAQTKLMGAGQVMVSPRETGKNKYDPDVIAWKPKEVEEILNLAMSDPDYEIIEDEDDDE